MTEDAKPKRTAKRAAATPEKDGKRTVYAFPLPLGSYYSVQVASRRSVAAGPEVSAIRQRLDMEPGAQFDEAVRDKVMQWQQDNDRPATGVVTADDWDALFNE